VTRIDGTVESCPCLKVTQRSFGSQNSYTDITFYRLSMPIECAECFSRSNDSLFSPKRVTTPHTHTNTLTHSLTDLYALTSLYMDRQIPGKLVTIMVGRTRGAFTVCFCRSWRTLRLCLTSRS